AHRRFRHANSACDLVDRSTLLAPQVPSQLPLTCFHFGKHTAAFGCERAPGRARTGATTLEGSRATTTPRARSNSVPPWIPIRGRCIGTFSAHLRHLPPPTTGRSGGGRRTRRVAPPSTSR